MRSTLVHAVIKAEEIYLQASIAAENRDWEKATKLLDNAYTVMEQSWRYVGVDV